MNESYPNGRRSVPSGPVTKIAVAQMSAWVRSGPTIVKLLTEAAAKPVFGSTMCVPRSYTADVAMANLPVVSSTTATLSVCAGWRIPVRHAPPQSNIASCVDREIDQSVTFHDVGRSFDRPAFHET